MRKKYPDRIVIDSDELDMPLVTALGFDHILTPIDLSPHLHKGYEIVYLQNGQACWVLDKGKKLPLSGGQASIVQPNTCHFGEWNIISPSTLFWIIINPDTPKASKNTTFTKQTLLHLQATLEKAGNITISTNAAQSSLFIQLLKDMAATRDNTSSMLSLPKLRALLCQIILEITQTLEIDVNQEVPASIANAITYMNKNIKQDLAISDIAAITNLSTSRFCDHFKTTTGMSPGDYFRRQKCLRAQTLLKESSKTITQVAFSLGFSSSQYFAKVFKKYTGMTPSEYRRH